jgi:hypothetical protein
MNPSLTDVQFGSARNRFALSVSDKLVASLAQSCPQLRKLILYVHHMDDTALRSVADNCPQLEVLVLNAPQKSSRLYHFRSTLRAIALRGKLTELSMFIATTWIGTEYAEMLQFCVRLKILQVPQSFARDDVLQALVQHCPLLEMLNVCETNVTGAGLLTLVEGLHRLRTVNVCHCRNVSKADIRAVKKVAPQVQWELCARQNGGHCCPVCATNARTSW